MDTRDLSALAYAILKASSIGAVLTIENTGGIDSPGNHEVRMRDALEIIKAGLEKAERVFEPKLITSEFEEEMERE